MCATRSSHARNSVTPASSNPYVERLPVNEVGSFANQGSMDPKGVGAGLFTALHPS